MNKKNINEIMREHPDRLGRIALQNSISVSKEAHTIFIPWAYYPKSNCWLGIKRWKGRNNKSIETDIMVGDRKMWFIYQKKWPILPKNHPLRKSLEAAKKLHEYRMKLRSFPFI